MSDEKQLGSKGDTEQVEARQQAIRPAGREQKGQSLRARKMSRKWEKLEEKKKLHDMILVL